MMIVMKLFATILFAFLINTNSSAFANPAEDRAREFCDKGEADICTELGKYYREGNPQYQIQKDLTKALELLNKGCDGGSAEGCNILSYMYGNGQGVKKESAKAVGFYQKACDGGISAGCFNLGLMYDNGQGVKLNDAKAVELYQKACEAGDDTGCYNLAMKYYKGEGVAKSTTNAIKYYSKSCDLKFKEGCNASAQLKSGKLK